MNKTKWYARPLYAIMALALVAGLMMVPAVVPGTPAVGPSIVQANSVTGVNITSPNTTSPWYGNSGGTIDVTYNVTADHSTYGTVRFDIGNATVNETVFEEDRFFTNGTTELSESLTVPSESVLSEGFYNLTLRAKQPPLPTASWNNTTQENAVIIDNSPPTGLNLTAPVSTTAWKAGSSHNITWNNATINDTVSGLNATPIALDYSTDNSGTWTTITNATANNGTYNWTLPLRISSAECKVRMTATDNATNSANCTSDTFTIFTIDITPPTITLNAPATDANITGSYTLNATASDDESGVASVIFAYSTDDVNWTTIGTSPNTTTPYLFSWNTTAVTDGAKLTVKVTATNGVGATNSTTATNVTVDNSAPTVELTAPTTSGGIFRGNYTCTATASDEHSNISKVYFYNSTDGVNWTEIDNTTTSPYNVTWNTSSIDCNKTVQVMAKAVNGANLTENSTAAINITVDNTLPSVNLTSPAGGEAWKVGTTQNITWNSTAINDTCSGLETTPIKLEYSFNGGTNWSTIINATANVGSYSWLVPGPVSNTTKVNITAVDKAGNTNSTTSENFTMYVITDTTLPTVNLTAPADNAVINGSSYNVTATASDAESGISQVVFAYSLDEGGNWTGIGTANTTPYAVSWDTSAINATGVWVRATATNGVGANNTDVNTGILVDSIAPTVTVTSPNGNETWLGDSTHAITWNATDTALATNPITIEYSTDNGTNWTNIASGEANDGTYSWTVPTDVNSTQCLVNVTALDLAGNAGSDQSNTTFTISPAPATSIELSEDWNLISVPKRLASGHNTFGDVLSDVNVSAVYGYDPTATPSWIPITDLNTTVEVLDGYWIAADTAGTITLTYLSGGKMTPPSKALTGKKWNAIGFSSTSAMSANATLKSIEGSWSTLIGWDATGQSYEDSIIFEVNDDTTMTPGKGYWVWMTADDTLSAVSA